MSYEKINFCLTIKSNLIGNMSNEELKISEIKSEKEIRISQEIKKISRTPNIK